MNNHKLETIELALLARLARITTGNSYLLTLYPERQKAVTKPSHLKAVLFDNPPDDPEKSLDGEFIWIIPFSVSVFIILNDDDETPLSTMRNNVLACIHLAINKDANGVVDHTLGGLIDRIDVIAPLPFQLITQGPEGVTFNFTIQYRHPDSDPTYDDGDDSSSSSSSY